MSRTKPVFKTKKEEAAHNAKLAARRERRHGKRTIKMAEQAAEGETDFAKLVEAEKLRMGQDELSIAGARGGKKSPAAITTARDNLTRAFDLMGGVPALVVWGRTNPTEFYRLWSKLLPKEAADEGKAMPLEDLLSKLASREEQTVGQAAMEIGMEMLEKGRLGAEEEDRVAATAPGSDSVQ